MSKYLILFFALYLCIPCSVGAQKSEIVTDNVNEEASFIKGGKFKVVFKPQNPTEDKTETLEVTGLGTSMFSVSNVSDGTAKSYKHALRISLGLLTSSKSGHYQLVFYSEGEDIPYSVSTMEGKTSIYYPSDLYNDIKQKLEQSFSAKKKVQLKIIQQTNGYKEGILIF